MKEAIIQFRLYIAEKRFSWALRVAPKGRRGAAVRITVREYFKAFEFEKELDKVMATKGAQDLLRKATTFHKNYGTPGPPEKLW